MRKALSRLENLGQGLGPEPTATIEKLQKRRNRIEHHRYDHREEDEKIISEALTFILFFVEGVLEVNLEQSVPAQTLRDIQALVFERQDRYWIARHRLQKWMTRQWPHFDIEEDDAPEEFEGTLDCPICDQEYLVVGYHLKPFCFHCNTSVDAWHCEDCGRSHMADVTRCPFLHDES